MWTQTSGEARPNGPTPNDMPPRLTEQPAPDRYCDVILNGGVASGVVYPWALLDLARVYRFRRLGGNSVGAMAACVAAAAEYGRCNGYADAFEPLRQMPVKLAATGTDDEGRPGSKMLRLFQPAPSLTRAFDLFVALTRFEPDAGAAPDGARSDASDRPTPVIRRLELRKVRRALLAYFFGDRERHLAMACGMVFGLVAVANLLFHVLAWALIVTVLVAGLVVAGVGLAVLAWKRVRRDLEGIVRNGYGFCPGKAAKPGGEALLEWLHEAVQRSAGLQPEDAPLSFADLWMAPRPGLAKTPQALAAMDPEERGIDLQMFCTNVTLGRPVCLPLNEQTETTLYFDPRDWEKIFPPALCAAVVRAARPYRRKSASDPDPAIIARRVSELENKSNRTPEEDKTLLELKQQVGLLTHLREVPTSELPIVVAARLSLSFPLLFTTVAVYAVDYEAPRDERILRKCLLTDGGLCANFPVHLFDAAQPVWPTFALELDERLPTYENERVWLPCTNLEGRADSWQRGVPGVYPAEKDGALSGVFRLASGMLNAMRTWNDTLTSKLPEVRDRVVRIGLRPGEGQLNIGMPGETIRRMAKDYGQASAARLIHAFAPTAGGVIARGWREHLYVRMQAEVRALRRHLRGYGAATNAGGSNTVSLADLLDAAIGVPPLHVKPGHSDPGAAALTPPQRDALLRTVRAIEALEHALAHEETLWGPYRPLPPPDLKLRPPL